MSPLDLFKLYKGKHYKNFKLYKDKHETNKIMSDENSNPANMYVINYLPAEIRDSSLRKKTDMFTESRVQANP